MHDTKDQKATETPQLTGLALLKAWQKSKLRPRVFFRSTGTIEAKNKEEEKSPKRWSETYVRPKRDGEIKGKKAIRAAKRERVRAMKAAQAEV